MRLLLGEIPERTVFVAAGMKAPLRPYFELTNVSEWAPGGDVSLIHFNGWMHHYRAQKMSSIGHCGKVTLQLGLETQEAREQYCVSL